MLRLVVLLLGFGCSNSVVAQMKLSIYPGESRIVMKRNENLTLTCNAIDDSSNKTYDLSWKHPNKGMIPMESLDSEIGLISLNKSHNALVITVRKIQKSDAGQYVCQVKDGIITHRQKINVVVNSDRDKCLPPFFDCGRLLCIPLHYVCDGFPDCPDGRDESFTHCGHDACEGKFFCDGRCVPKKYCCNPITDLNCSARYLIPCCERFINDMLPMDILKMEPSESPVQYKFHNLGFYQSTVYTMISCAIAFIFMSTIMLIAVCRIRMRRNAWFMQSSRSSHQHRFWHRSSVPSQHGCTGAINVDRCHSSAQTGGQSDGMDPLENFVLLRYDRNTGFELAEYGPKPPPYAETNLGIPPPPYSSMVDVSADPSNPGNGADGAHSRSAGNPQQ